MQDKNNNKYNLNTIDRPIITGNIEAVFVHIFNNINKGYIDIPGKCKDKEVNGLENSHNTKMGTVVSYMNARVSVFTFIQDSSKIISRNQKILLWNPLLEEIQPSCCSKVKPKTKVILTNKLLV